MDICQGRTKLQQQRSSATPCVPTKYVPACKQGTCNDGCTQGRLPAYVATHLSYWHLSYWHQSLMHTALYTQLYRYVCSQALPVQGRGWRSERRRWPYKGLTYHLLACDADSRIGSLRTACGCSLVDSFHKPPQDPHQGLGIVQHPLAAQPAFPPQ